MGKKIHRDQLVPVSSWTQPLAIVPPAACTVPVLREPHRLNVGNRAGLVDKNVAAANETDFPLQRDAASCVELETLQLRQVAQR